MGSGHSTDLLQGFPHRPAQRPLPALPRRPGLRVSTRLPPRYRGLPRHGVAVPGRCRGGIL